ncbi:MAG: pilus assembly protein [Deltaproteobacteria bacterium]|nr:pilus assembly protein [Deltaproteobacteria bacterium]
MTTPKFAQAGGGCGEKGNIVVELALVLPLLLLILAGIVDLGTLYWEKQIIINAASEGARVAARAGSGGNAAQSTSQIMQIVQDQLDKYALKDAGGNRIVLTSGSNFNYQWDTAVTPVQLWVEIKNIPVALLLLPNVLPLWGSGDAASPPALQAKTTVAAEWTVPPP